MDSVKDISQNLNTSSLIPVLLIFGLFLFSPEVHSQSIPSDTSRVCGTVIDQKDNEPLPGSVIHIEESNQYLVTDQNGYFCISLPSGTWTFKFSHLGRQPITKTISISEETEKKILIKMKETTTSLEELNVIGKSNTRETKESSTVSLNVSKDFLEQNRENSLMQTLAKVPGVSTISIGSGLSKPTIRGLGFNRVAVVQNGIKHEAQQWGQDHGLEIDQYGIENIRIIKGPASLLYGSDAIAGIVDIQPSSVPKKDTLVGDMNVLGETNNKLLGLSAGLETRNNNWFYRGRLTYRDYADYKVPTSKVVYDTYIFDLHDQHLRNTAGKEANASVSVGYIGKNIRTETFLSNVYAKNGFFANAHGLEVRTSKIKYDQSDRDIDLPFHQVNHFKVTNNTSITAGQHTLHWDVGYQNNHREEHSEPVPHGYMPKPPNSKEREFNKNTYSLNIRDEYSPTNKHSISAGFNAELQDNTIDGWGFLIPAFKRFTWGVFAYDQFEVYPNVHLQAGVRYDYGILDTEDYTDWYTSPVKNADGTTTETNLQRSQEKKLSFDNISASVGLSYIRDNTSYKINLGKSFRMPLANELASDGVNYHMYRYEQGNLNLDAEESYQVDVEIDHSTQRFNFSISPFINLYENYIYLNPTPDYYETLQIYEYTQSKVFRAGGEISMGALLYQKLQLNASAEYVYSRQTNGAKEGFTLPFSPPLSGLISVSYQFKRLTFLHQPRLTADYKITAAQDKIVPPEEKTDGYQVMNLSLSTDVPLFGNHKPVAMRIKLNNLFDTKYYDHTSFYRLIDVPEAGRNFSVSLTIPF